ncbi:glycerophosphodiester phosphodiesterase GDPD4-like isoform X1 [Lolium rigidum]|uniref:glycerophosphodiester phosphodiesterase GDPD4-like isoform X1 n=1 Tax=Lolium rigidum TaxID=89674 RepID=UPI001F5DCF89|nr:glycerophosphodiester phosphodiesterase GDPD4-like isoform X1 [Lolium rigidum]
MRGLIGLGRQPPPLPLFPAAKRASPYATLPRSLRRCLPASRLLRLLFLLAALSLVAPVFFHLRLRCFHRMRERTCGWIASPPMVCAHGGDSANAFPNSMDAFRMALDARVDCVEVDVSRSSDGTLFALHDRDLQRMSGNSTAKVGHWSAHEIKALSTKFQLSRTVQNQEVPKVEDALALIAQSARQVILDIKVGPPSFDKGLLKMYCPLSREQTAQIV